MIVRMSSVSCNFFFALLDFGVLLDFGISWGGIGWFGIHWMLDFVLVHCIGLGLFEIPLVVVYRCLDIGVETMYNFCLIVACFESQADEYSLNKS